MGGDGAPVQITVITDPGCPWAYSAEPSMTALRWRYGDQLSWRYVMIGLTESGKQYEERGYTPALHALAPVMFGKYGMPFATAPRERMIGTGRACRAIVAVRLMNESLVVPVLRALHFAWFTSDLLLDEDDALAEALARVEGLDAAEVISRLDSSEVEEAYQRDREVARSAEGSPASLQGKTARTDGPERFTAPTLIAERNGTRLVAGGHQPTAAYDVVIANVAPELDCTPPPDDPMPLLERFPYGLTTREVSRTLAERNAEPDDNAALGALVNLVTEGRAVREPLGDDALWRVAPSSAAG
jgi:predicted DsbA family dithiol-disulfide isomerase